MFLDWYDHNGVYNDSFGTQADPVGEAAQQTYARLRALLDIEGSFVIVTGFVWSPTSPLVHSGALCEQGVELLLAEDVHKVVTKGLDDLLPRLRNLELREYDTAEVVSLCPDCTQAADRVLEAAFVRSSVRVVMVEDAVSVVNFFDNMESLNVLEKRVREICTVGLHPADEYRQRLALEAACEAAEY